MRREGIAVMLEPRRVAHAEALFAVLADPALYAYIEEAPPASVQALRDRLAQTESRRSPDGTEHWLNWVVRDDDGEVAGYVQATVGANGEAHVAYMLSAAWQGHGLATEAVARMLGLVEAEFGTRRFFVVAERRNTKSVRVAERLGFVEVPVEMAARRRVAAGDVLLQKDAGPAPGSTQESARSMDIERFMQGYKNAWEQRDEAMFAALFRTDGEYRNTPFAVQRGRAQLAEYWQRVKLQEDVALTYEVLASSPGGGIAHWHVTYQVASEALFEIWARSTGTNLVGRRPGDPLPRMVLDGVLKAEFADGLCARCDLWWHSLPQAPASTA